MLSLPLPPNYFFFLPTASLLSCRLAMAATVAERTARGGSAGHAKADRVAGRLPVLAEQLAEERPVLMDAVLPTLAYPDVKRHQAPAGMFERVTSLFSWGTKK